MPCLTMCQVREGVQVQGPAPGLEPGQEQGLE